MSNSSMFKFGRKTVAALASALALWTVAWPAGAPTRADEPTTSPSDTTAATDDQSIGSITLQPGKAMKKHFDQRIKRANILAPDIADIVPLDPNELLLTAKKAGTTQLIIWDENNETQVFNVEVATPVAILQKRIEGLFPESKINVEDANGTITLTGQVHDLETARRVESIALPYAASTHIVDLMEVGGGQQVMLKVKFAQVSKQAEQQLGFNFGGQNGSAIYGSNFGPNSLGIQPGGTGGPNLLLIPASALATGTTFGTGQFANAAFAYFVEALENNSLLRTLDEPNLVTTSGQQATFLAGGQIPYPVPQTGAGGGSTITIAWQKYGVQLTFTPIVLGNGRIRLKVNPEVSDLDYGHELAVAGGDVPALTDQNVDTTVELAEGQTFALAGLLQNNITAQSQKFPFLGDIPIIGALFRTVTYQKDESELVVLVTPVLVHAMNPADVTPVPGEHWRDPNSLQLYFLGDLGGEVAPPPPARPDTTPADFEGPAGFQPPPSTTAPGAAR
jgi:pilus assembly protein CpaC